MLWREKKENEEMEQNQKVYGKGKKQGICILKKKS